MTPKKMPTVKVRRIGESYTYEILVDGALVHKMVGIRGASSFATNISDKLAAGGSIDDALHFAAMKTNACILLKDIIPEDLLVQRTLKCYKQ